MISVKNISKRYRIGVQEQQKDTLVAQIGAFLRKPVDNFRQLRSLSRFSETDESVFWALRDVSFEVAEGEVLGIIGHNGAGKSTLLKILSRITEPSSGEIRMRGRVSSLLEVGTGFHPDLTGRENIYMNGTILGMTRREIDRKFDEIVAFSGIEKHIDTPVKRYSSGMTVRLAFSVAAHLEPEILIIDEVLAVGDAEFQKKCLGRMKDVAGEGRTVLFVSHNMAAVQNLCSKIILLKKGYIDFYGDVHKGIKKYFENNITSNQDNDKYGIGGVYKNKGQKFKLIKAISEVNNVPSDTPISGEEVKMSLYFEKLSDEIKDKLSISLTIYRNGEIVSNLWTDYFEPVSQEFSLIKIICMIPKWCFREGQYSVDLYAHCSSEIQDWIEGLFQFESIEKNIYSDKGVLNQFNKGIFFIDHNWKTEDGTKK